MSVDPALEIARLETEIVEVCHRMYERRLIVAQDGNVSVRIAEDEMLITRSGICKGEMTPADVLRIDFDGKVISGAGKPSSESFMHIACYEERPDIAAIVHAHPPTAVAFTLAGRTLAQCVIPEVVLSIGAVPTLPYTTPTTMDIPNAIRRVVRHADALMLERHGSVCVGSTAKDAYFKLETIEHAAEITLKAQQLGRVKTLPPEEIQRLLKIREGFTLDGRNPLCNECILNCYEGVAK